MPLAAGTKLGAYEIIAPIGAGGMGEVYRAKDTKLKRDVAIKVLPEAFVCDPERMTRFQREAEVLASLNHPNIAAIYGVEERALVMELVEGASPKGPMPFDDAWKIAFQIAAALEYAHDKGIVHRDLKPDNIKITPDGAVKLLDFGLAKAFTDQKEASANPEHSPTLTIGATEVGVILGTAAYMSPEQAKGKSVDKRADIWAFGAVLYELLAGARLFKGDDIADTLAQVLTKEPPLDRVPLKARKLLRRCLEKDPRQRLRDVGDAHELLESVEAPKAAARWPWIAAVALLAIIAAAASWIAWRATRPADHPLTRLSVDLGPDAMTGLNTTVVISPDGRRIVYPARGADSKPQLVTRLLDQAQSVLLPGTEGGFDPFFSPDGQWIGFFADGQLKKISVQGGAPVTLCADPEPYGGSWSEDGNIVTGSRFVPLLIVPAAGGTPKTLTKLAPDEIAHRWPQVLPGGQAVLFTASSLNPGQDDANIEAIALKTGQVKVLLHGGYYGRYVPGGYLVYVHQGVLFGVRFDPVHLEVHGTPAPLVDDVAANPLNGGGQFDVSGMASGSGLFVHLVGKVSAQTWGVAWLDSSGKMQPMISAPSVYAMPRFSPDGRKLAFMNGPDVSVYDLDRGATTRLTFTGNASAPIWAPDGRHLVFRSGSGLYWVRSDGAGEPQRLLESQNQVLAWSVSPNGPRVAYREQDPKTGQDLWTLPLNLTDPDHSKPGKPELFLRTAFDENVPTFSPDGRWIAYSSNESGANQIYVRPFPAANGGKWQISTEAALYALWSRNGRELFYETADYRIMVLDYTVNGDSFVPTKPRLWAEKQLFFPGYSNLDLAPDGMRFAVLTTPEATGGEKGSVHVTVLLNFFDELRRRIPAK